MTCIFYQTERFFRARLLYIEPAEPSTLISCTIHFPPHYPPWEQRRRIIIPIVVRFLLIGVMGHEAGIRKPKLCAVACDDNKHLVVTQNFRCGRADREPTYSSDSRPGGALKDLWMQTSCLSIQLVRMDGCLTCGGIVDCNPFLLISPAVDDVWAKEAVNTAHANVVNALGAPDKSTPQLISGMIVRQVYRPITRVEAQLGHSLWPLVRHLRRCLCISSFRVRNGMGHVLLSRCYPVVSVHSVCSTGRELSSPLAASSS